MNEIISQLNTISAQWWEIIMPNSIQLLILFAVLFCISYLLRKKSALLQYSLWMIFLLKAFFPIQFNFTSLSTSSIPALNYVYSSINLSKQTVQNSGIDLSLQSILFLSWSVIILGLIARLLYKEKQFNRILKKTDSVELNDILNPLKSAMDISQDVVIRTGKEVPAPFTKGLWNPVIYLPRQTLKCNNDQVRAILAHELAHIKRKDIIFIYLQNITDILYFFHPAVWLGNKDINLHREKICDEIAIQTLQESPNNYGKTLLNNLKYLFTNRKKAALSNNLFFSKKAILKRFEYLFNKKKAIILKLKKSHYFVLITVVILSIFLACTGITSSNGDNNKIPINKSLHEEQKFVSYDKAPRPQGGFQSIQENITYPKIAREAGIEGKVIVRAFINNNGKVEQCTIDQGIPNTGMNQAAIDAVKKTTFEPAIQENEPVGVWISVPIFFRLHNQSQNQKKPKSKKQRFVAYDTPPKPVGGFETLQKNLKYPQKAKNAGIEGKVIVRAFINKNGYVENCKIENGIPNTGLNDAAIAALKKTKFTPAKQKDKPVGIWISIPIFFRLEE